VKSQASIEASRRPVAGSRRAARRPPSEPSFPELSADSPTKESIYDLAYAEEALRELRNFLRQLDRADRIAFAGAAGNLLFSFLPWKETVADGEVLGLLSLGFPVLVASGLGIAAMAMRVRKTPTLSPVISWAVQLISGCFGIVWCLAFILLSWDSHPVASPIGNFEMATSRPAIGVFLALLGSGVSVTGTFLGLKQPPA
jgi:hypothetical protein